MDQAVAPRRTRAQYRHELRTPTYVTLDQGNGGVIRDLTHVGIGVQVIEAVHPRQQVRVRFELSAPELFVTAPGEVVWSTSAGQCGIRFLNLSRNTARGINEWIFGDMLEDLSLHLEGKRSLLAKLTYSAPLPGATSPALHEVDNDVLGHEIKGREDGKDDGLMVSATVRKVIELPLRAAPEAAPVLDDHVEHAAETAVELDWLSQPLSSRGLIWTINTLVIVAALLLCALVFLSVVREIPRWPLAMSVGAAIVVGAMYWGFFKAFGRISPGARLARLVQSSGEDDAEENGSARFR